MLRKSVLVCQCIIDIQSAMVTLGYGHMHLVLTVVLI